MGFQYFYSIPEEKLLKVNMDYIFLRKCFLFLFVSEFYLNLKKKKKIQEKIVNEENDGYVYRSKKI